MRDAARAGLRLALPPRNEAAPLALLLLALASVFVFGNDRSQFYRPEHHDWVSAETLTIAANLSAEHGFLGFRRQKLGEDGEREYVVYNRFPIGPYALVKLAILPFGGGFGGQVHAARLLMLAFFAAAAVLAWLAIARLLGDRPIALAAALLAFSSYYLLYYNDTVSAEASTNLFGVMLAFHGMVLFAQEGRFRQLLAKTAVALLLGWHAMGLVAAFVPRAILSCGAFSALCCAILLGFNLGNEYRALGGEVPLRELPSFQSILRRTGTGAESRGPDEFLQAQFGAVGVSAIPFAALDRIDPRPSWPPHPGFAVLGAAVFAACLAGLRFLPHRVLFAALLLAGWAWAIPFRENTAYHDFEGMFHAGVPLVLFALALQGLRRLAGGSALPALAVAAGAAFVLSTASMGRVGHDAEAAQRQREAASDFRAMRS